ncbi:MAG: hypothetical protein H6Q10_98 [Acidobacteria bacterium]|nr:hypothetical protein [Acidobacteriota bacterium]
MRPPARPGQALRVVLFSGGRGSAALSTQLVRRADVSLTIAINGYDDGLSTGEVRRFLGDALGPSDFRKNASRVAKELRSCPPAAIDLLDLRLPEGATRDEALAVFDAAAGRRATAPGWGSRACALAGDLPAELRGRIGARLDAFRDELLASGRPFEFSDCSLGNLVFAGSFLACGRRFNDAVDDYCALVGLPAGLVDNVTDGTNAFLVALDADGRLLASEGEIVDATRQNRIADIYLIDRPVDEAGRERLAGLPVERLHEALEARTVRPGLSPRVADALARADLIVYAPGTQHSSLFPSYLVPGLCDAIADNLGAVKVLITNLQADAEIAGSSAVDIIERAVFYLKEKGRRAIPTPCLITHYIINDPGHGRPEASYVPLGKLDTFEDPRLVRVGHYEDGVTGRHDGSKVLTPFLDARLARGTRRRVAVWLHDGASTDKTTQTLLELVRAGALDLPLELTIFCQGSQPLAKELSSRLPFRVVDVPPEGARGVREALAAQGHEYLVLFESSGMYLGEDLVELLSHLPSGRLDGVWGSRRLSVRDIAESIRLRYRGRPGLRWASRAGSQALSASYLLLYGRYVTDTLSGARCVRARYALAAAADPDDKLLNQRLLSLLMRDRAELIEIPVRFFPLSPERVRRTTVPEGLRSLAMIGWWRLHGLPGTGAPGGRP